MSEFKNRIQRIQLYLKERYFPVPYFLASVITAIALKAVVELDPTLGPVTNLNVALVAFNVFVFPLLMRICDEVKDLESDRIHFPERCIPRGDVKIQDVTQLGWVLLILFLIFNLTILISQGKSLLIFSGLMLYLWFFLKYFYMPAFVSENLMAALIFSNPITLWLAYYNLCLYVQENNFFTYKNAAISILFWAPSWIWEVCRKIRKKSDEREYQTYSKVLGIPMAALIPVCGIGLMVYLIDGLSVSVVSHTIIRYIIFFVFSFYFLYMLFFVLRPSTKHAEQIRPITEFILAILSLTEIAFIFMEKI